MGRERLPRLGAFAPHGLELPFDALRANIALKAQLLEQEFQACEAFFLVVANETHVDA